MNKIICLGSGSKGNSYAVDDGRSVLLLEAGLSASKITAGYRELLPRVVGCLITHEHMDHARGAAELARRGIPLYLSKGTMENLPEIQNPYALKIIQGLLSLFICTNRGGPLVGAALGRQSMDARSRWGS